MKKQLLLYLLMTYCGITAFGQITSAGSGPWQTYQVPGGAPPAGWQTDCTTANWGNPVAGTPAPGQRTLFDGRYSPTATANNYIWDPGGAGGTAYFKHCFTLTEENGCGQFILTHNADDINTVWVNGIQVDALTGWTQNGQVDITPWLSCGENTIAVQATNVFGGPSFFIGQLQQFPVALFPPPDLSYDVPDCDAPSINLYAPMYATPVIYSWTGPNGFSSSDPNPVINPAGPSNEGWYECTIIRQPCCAETGRIYVRVPENCCDEKLLVERTNCTEFDFSLTDDQVDKHCAIWRQDGVVVGTGNTYSSNLSPGTHTVCVNYLGTQKKNPNEICCEERCYTVSIPQVVFWEEQTLTTCKDHLWYKPESCALYDHYIITDLDPSDDHLGFNFNYNSSTNPTYGGPGCAGWIHHRLIHGNYIFDFYDEYGCLLKTLQLTIAPAPPVVHQVDYDLCLGECVTFNANDPAFPCSPNNGLISGYTNNIGYLETDEITICRSGFYHIETTTTDGCICVVEGNINIAGPPLGVSYYEYWCLGQETFDLSTIVDPCAGAFTETWEDLTDSIYGFPPGPVIQLPGPILQQNGGAIFRHGDLLHYRYRAYDENGCLICEYDITLQAILCAHTPDPNDRQGQLEAPKEETVDIVVYPNPTSDHVEVVISGKLAEGDQLNLYDIEGRLLISQALLQNQTLDVSAYPSGVYLLRCGTEPNIQIKEIMVE